ncbi:hypothetical protein [Parachlamydia sp. AcF125]|uniref:hypothetical protein n=1 Tax=Parachlamydia sp. AcF125 TaxID=2795736 RepID=UPI001BC9F739|nr:hypothetical protein [Parachlamydia sp. AcF125]MBS4169152.1 hypothetical protein [Parachlamydia sp. AcF125]
MQGAGNPTDFIDSESMNNLIQLTSVSPSGNCSGRKVVNWQNMQGVLIATTSLATLAFKIYNLVQGKFYVDELDVGANIALGFQARLLLPHLASEKNLKSIMNFMQRYSLEMVMALTQFYLNAPSSIPLVALNQSILTFFNTLLGLLTTDSLITAFTLKKGDLEYSYLHSSKPLPLLSGEAQKGKHFFIYSAWKAAACVAFLIPKDKYHLCQASGIFFGSNFLGGLFSFLSRKFRIKALKPVQNAPTQDPSLAVRVLNNLAVFNQVTHPIVIAFLNVILPKVFPAYNVDIGIAGFLYGMNSQEQKYHFQQSFLSQSAEESRLTPETSDLLWPGERSYSGHEYVLVPANEESAGIMSIRDKKFSNIYSGDDSDDNEETGQPTHRLIEGTVLPINGEEEANEKILALPRTAFSSTRSARQSMQSTAAKVQNYAKSRWKELSLMGAFVAVTLGFTIWGATSDDATSRDLISGACIVGGMFLAYIYALTVSSKFDPQNASPPRKNVSNQSCIAKSYHNFLEAIKNTTFFKTIIDPYGFVFAFLLLNSLGIRFDDADFKNSETLEYIMQNLALGAYGANWGLHRAKADRLNRPDRSMTPVMVLNILVTVAYLQATGYYNQQPS